MRISVLHRCPDFEGYRAMLVKSLFNIERGDSFELDAELPLEAIPQWRIGVVVGPSGSGKSSIGRQFWGAAPAWSPAPWPTDAPIIEAVAPDATFEGVTSALSAVGLGTVPAWLRRYDDLSTGERFRAELARLLCEAPVRAVVDEFTSVVDRQAACIGAGAFAKAWRRLPAGQVVLLTCHRDVLDWLQPDWAFDTGSGRFSGRWLQRRPPIELRIVQTDLRWWQHFAHHHYLTVGKTMAAAAYVGFVGDEPVAHVAFSTRPGLREARAFRLVVMPEWQGAGVGMRFLDAVCAAWRRGENRYGRPMPTLFHTSHPGLAAALRRNPLWAQVSAVLHGVNKERCRASLARSGSGNSHGYGGHFRAVQGFRYVE